MPVIFSGNVPFNPIKKAKCGYVCKPNDYKMLAKNILKYRNLSINDKRKLSNNAKTFFEKNYNIKERVKELNNLIKLI